MFTLVTNYSLNKNFTITDQGYRGQNNGRSTDMTGQILRFVRPKFSVITEMTGHSFLEQLEKISLEISSKR